MEKAFNEIGKLRNEMKVGFIELENQIQSSNESLRQEMLRTSEATIKALSKFSQKVESGFLAIEEALDQDLKEIKSEISDIKKRLDDANI